MRLALIVLLAAACGASDPGMDDLCGDQPTSAQGDYVTQAGCAYEQQTDNILAHGTLLAKEGVALTDASGAQVATAQYSCGRYVMGKDPSGVAIIVNSTSGGVTSHGMVHAGFPKSSLTAVRTPVAY